MQTLDERFWTKVQKGDGCWLWTACKDQSGYGRLGARVDGSFFVFKAHRLSWELAHGPIPEGVCVLHRCDTPSCVRPDHLFLGSKQDNYDDMVNKGRRRIVFGGVAKLAATTPGAFAGTKNPRAKLTDEDVRYIRHMSDEGASRIELARKFGITGPAVRMIVTRTTWRHVV